jgi:hypothetical protein
MTPAALCAAGLFANPPEGGFFRATPHKQKEEVDE